MKNRMYVAIDLKSFYASVECILRGLDPLKTNLVVADKNRTEKTICLAVSPSLKTYGIPGRARLFEVVQKVKEANAVRKKLSPSGTLTGASSDSTELEKHPDLAVDYIIAPPKMAHYMEVSTKIYGIYLKYVAPEDIHVYSIDEVFIDVTDYLKTYGMSARELTMKMILDVLRETGITATAGIGTNMYLCKIAMDIEAKHIPADENGVRIAELDEESYRRKLWCHRPLTDFWRVGKGTAKRLEAVGIYTMGDIARASVGKISEYYNEALLYKMFGVNAELLIDHAWGYEPCRIADVKAYKPSSSSICSGQVLKCPYEYEKARVVMREMADALALDLADKKIKTNQIVMTLVYDVCNLTDPKIKYSGEVTKDNYGREIPKHAHGTENLAELSSSSKELTAAALRLFDRITDRRLFLRKLYITAANLTDEDSIKPKDESVQLDFFTDYEAERTEKDEKKALLEKEKRMQEAMLKIKKKHGKNAILKGTNFEDGATARERNGQIGGHKA